MNTVKFFPVMLDDPSLNGYSEMRFYASNYKKEVGLLYVPGVYRPMPAVKINDKTFGLSRVEPSIEIIGRIHSIKFEDIRHANIKSITSNLQFPETRKTI